MSYLRAGVLCAPHRHIPCLTSVTMIAVKSTSVYAPMPAGVVENGAA